MSTKDDREKMLSGNDRRPRREREGKAGEEKKSVKKRVRNIFLIFLGLVFLVLLGIYIAGVVHFKDRFFLHTTINGFDASEMTVNEVEDIIAEKIGSYKLEIAERGGCLLYTSSAGLSRSRSRISLRHSRPIKMWSAWWETA